MKQFAPRRGKDGWIEAAWTFIATLTVAAIINTWFVSCYRVPTDSMKPAIPAGSHIIVDRTYHHPRRGDIIVFRDVQGWTADSAILVKRVIGVAGDTVEMRNNVLLVNGQRMLQPWTVIGTSPTFSYTVPPGSVFVLGDNRANSSDSSRHPDNPFVPLTAIRGVVRFTLAPAQ